LDEIAYDPKLALPKLQFKTLSIVRQIENFGRLIKERIWRISVSRYASLPQYCKRLVLTVSRLILSLSRNMVRPRPK
jgi:hypothetical protein